MSYLLDTNAWAAYLSRRHSSVVHRIEQTPPDEIRLCSVVKAELYFGAYKSPRREANLALLMRIFRQFASLPFDDAASKVCGQVRSSLEKQGTPIGPNDLMIAAIALANGLTLVTHNVREFERVEGLRIEDWQGSA